MRLMSIETLRRSQVESGGQLLRYIAARELAHSAYRRNLEEGVSGSREGVERWLKLTKVLLSSVTAKAQLVRDPAR